MQDHRSENLISDYKLCLREWRELDNPAVSGGSDLVAARDWTLPSDSGLLTYMMVYVIRILFS